MRLQVPPTGPLVPMQNGMRPSPVQHLPMGYPVLSQPILPATGHLHLVSMSCGLSSLVVVNGIPAQGNFQSIRRSSATENITDSSMEVGSAMQTPCSGVSSMTDMSLSPASTMSTSHFPFNLTDISGIGTNLMPLDVAFLSGDTVGPNGVGKLQVVPDVGGSSLRASLRSLGQLPQNFSLSNLTTDLTNGGGERKDQKTFDKLCAERQAKIDEHYQRRTLIQACSSLIFPCSDCAVASFCF